MAVASRKKKKKSNKSQKAEASLLEVVKSDANSEEGFAEKQYLTLLKNSLVNTLYADLAMQLYYLEDCVAGKAKYNPNVFYNIKEIDGGQYNDFVNSCKEAKGYLGRPIRFSHTNVGLNRLTNIEECAKEIFKQSVDGDFVSFGDWKGGASVFMRGLQKVYKEDVRNVWLCKSFSKRYVSEHEIDQNYTFKRFLIPETNVGKRYIENSFKDYQLYDDSVKFAEVDYADVPSSTEAIDKIALLRVDTPFYDSTRATLDALYDKVSKGGYVIVDDYHLSKPCQQAVDEFRKKNNIIEPPHNVDTSCIYWQKA